MKSSIFIITLLLAPIILLAQFSTIHLQPDVHYKKKSDVSATTKMSLNNQEYTYSVSANMKTDYDIVRKTTNGFDIKVTLESINTELSSNGVKMSFDSQKDTVSNIEDTIFAKPLSDILGESDMLNADSTGKILSSDTSATHRKAAEYITSTLLSGNDYTVGKRLDIIFHFKDSVKVGSTWIDSISTSDGMRIDTFTIAKIYNKVVYVSVTGQITRTLPVQQGGKTAMARFEGNTNSVLQVSESTGIVSNRKMKTWIHSEINVNKIAIPITSEIQLNETVE